MTERMDFPPSEEKGDETEGEDQQDGGYIEKNVESVPQVHSNGSDEPETEEGNSGHHHHHHQHQQESVQETEEKNGSPTNVEEFGPEKRIKSDLNLLVLSEKDGKLNGGESVVREGPEVQTGRKNKYDSESERGDLAGEMVDNDDVDSIPPALPPRPPRPRQPCTCTCGLEETNPEDRNDRRVPRSCWSSGLRKYVFLCTACGSLSILLGALFLTVYFMLKSYTSSLNHFETIPTYVPSGMLVATGFLIVCLAWRKNRNNFLMKLCGLCSLCCAVLCVSVTVTTTVIHMNRLQTLRECLYTQKTQSCTCYSMMIDNNRISDEGIKFVFNSTPDCEVIHGALYSCLRAIFGLSVIGILVCIFGCMLVYQLLSHEKKKMYWAQLEMRCRYLYRQQRNPHYYACCDECRYPPHPQLFPWELMRNRFWSTGRIGNLYTPNPEDRGNHNRLRSGWNWRRLPWSRNGGAAGGMDGTVDPARGNLGSPDSQYGFSSTIEGAPYTVLDPRTTGGISVCPPGIPGADITEGGFYSWGPPPPYASNRNSANNSPARRSLGELLNHVSPVRRNDNVSPARSSHHMHHRHHVHHGRRCSSSPRQAAGNAAAGLQDSYQKSTAVGRNSAMVGGTQQEQQMSLNPAWSNSLSSVHRFQKVIPNKDNYENMYESEVSVQSNGFNTLPSLKKKNQTRVNEVLTNEAFTAYYFSSADNLGCSTSNIGPQSLGEGDGLPPRLSLTSEQPNTSRHGPGIDTVASNDVETSNEPQILYGSDVNAVAEGRGGLIRSAERNSSLVKKLLSPAKAKTPKTPQQDVPPYLLDRKLESSVATPKRVELKMDEDIEGIPSTDDGSSESGITLHYRVGIPRSPNVQNFSQLSKKNIGSFHWVERGGKDGSGSESWSNERASGSEISQAESVGKGSKGVKYLVKNMELLQKHNSLINEFKTLDLSRNLKCKDNKSENRKTPGIENKGYHQVEDVKSHVVRTDQENLSGTHTPKIHEPRHGKLHYPSSEPEVSEEYLTGSINESDIYFGDASNSSVYALESLHEEGSNDDVDSLSRYASQSHSLLNKQNLKIIETESSAYEERPKLKHSETPNYKRHHQNKYRHGNQYLGEHGSEDKSDEMGSQKSETFAKHQGWNYLEGPQYKDPGDPRVKYLNPVPGRGFPDTCLQPSHRQDPITSTDEQSSSSLTTADSGISAGKNYTKHFDNSYQEMGYRLKDGELMSQDAGQKSGPFEGLSEFAHPLFQKPKFASRCSRYKEGGSGHGKKFDGGNDSETGSELMEAVSSQRLRGRTYATGTRGKNYEETEEVSNQLLSTCNLSLSPRYLSEEAHSQFKGYPGKHDGSDQVSVQSDEGTRKSPKPLPRTSLPNRSGGGEENTNDYPKPAKSSLKKEKLSNSCNGSNHFLAPDAQYEFQSPYNSETKIKAHTKHGDQVPGTRVKPAISARPTHIQEEHKKSPGKLNSINVHVMGRGSDGVRPVPRRRRGNGTDVQESKDVEIGTHSVNV